MSSSKDSLSVGQTILLTREEILSEAGVYAYNADSHEVNNPPQMPVASFGDSACALKLTGLIDRRIDARISDQRLMGLKVPDIADFCQKCSAGSITDTIDGSKDVHFFDHHGLTKFGEDTGNLIEAFHQVQDNRYFLRQDELLGKAIGTDRAFCRRDKFLSADRDLSAFTAAIQSFDDGTLLGCSDATCGGELLEKTEHRLRKDICQRLQLRECALQHSFDLVFGGSDEMGYGLPLPGEISEIFQVLRDGHLSDGILVSHKETSDRKGVFLVGLGLSQRQFGEIGDEKWIKDNSFNLLGAEKGEEIDMIAACGLHGSAYLREVTTDGFDRLQQSGKTCGIHGDRQGEPDFSFGINTCSGKGILGYVNADKQSVQCTTSLQRYLSKAGKASQPILHSDKDSMIQSTYHGYGRQGTDSLKGSSAQETWSSPACPTSMGKTHSYKSYNINSM
jgi:hypothetical protein